MNAERYIELLNLDIDGGLSEAERQELDACLEISPEAKQYQSKLRAFATLMNSVPQRSPEPGLRQKIIDQVRLPSRRVFNIHSSSRPLPKGTEIGLAFAAGILLAVGIYQFVPDQYPDKDFAGMVGTLVGGQDQAGGAIDDRLALESDEVTAAVSMRHERDIYEIEFDLMSDGPINVEADFENAGLEFGGFARQTTGIAEFQVTDGTLKVRTQGAGQFALFLQKASPRPREIKVEIRLFADGEQVYRGALTAQ